jgi:hypothetical protein
MPVCGLQGEFIPIRPKTEQAAARDVTEIALVPKFLSCKSIAQVNLNEGNLDRQKGISQRDTCMREATGIQDDKFDFVDGGPLHPVDKFMFRVTLKAFKFVSQFPGDLNAAELDVSQRGRAINIRFARSEQVQIGTINEQQAGHL